MKGIVKQGIGVGVVNIIAVLFGAINTIFIYDRFISDYELGRMKYIISFSMLLIPFISVGANNIVIKFYHDFKERNNNNIFFLLFVVISCAYLLFLLASHFIFRNVISGLDIDFFPISLMILFWSYNLLLTGYIHNLKKIIIPSIFNNLWIKLGTGVITLISFYLDWEISVYLNAIVGVYFIALLGNFLYARYLSLFEEMDFNFKIEKDLIKLIKRYAFFIILGGLSSAVITQIDMVMVKEILNDYNRTGIYGVSLFIGSLMVVPVSSLTSVANPILAEKFAQNRIKDVEEIYVGSSRNLFVMGCLLFLLIWLSLDDLYDFFQKDQWKSGKPVVFFIMVSKLFDMLMGVNTSVINYSKYYSFNFYTICVLSIGNIILNFVFIPEYGMMGAAMASLISLSIFNIAKFWFLYYKFGFIPFEWNTLKTLAVGILFYLIFISIDINMGNPVSNVVLRSILITVPFLLISYVLGLSDLLVNVVNKNIKKIKK
mgnify:CR=1 FL=1